MQFQDYINSKNVNEHTFDPVGLFTFLRTYSRRKDESELIETWVEALNRIIVSCNTQLNCNFTFEEQKVLYEILYHKKASVAGRFLWSLGTKTVEKSGLTSLQNCAFIKIDRPIYPFKWAMNMLMMGTGVGFSVFQKDVAKLPKPFKVDITRNDVKDADFIIPDSRQGWVKLLEETLRAHFETGQSFSYSCMLLRSAGEPLKGFGGVASGSKALCEGIHQINTLLNSRAGDVIRPIDALDIMCIIAQVVVSGNVRRSALLSLGDCDDEDYLNAKNWSSGTVPNWRANVNCSIECSDFEKIKDNQDFWNLYNGSSEPYGLINLKLHQTVGRTGDTNYPDKLACGVNPCSEQSLENHETCCLAELFLPNINSLEELKLCAQYMYRVCKHSLTLECKDSKETQEVVHRNMRMGLGITGYLQATEEQRKWLPEVYTYIREYDVHYSAKHGFPVSIKLTTVKPSGCSRKDSLIQTSNGLLRLDEIGDVNGDEWQSIFNLNVNTDSDNTENVSKFYKNGCVESKIIRTISGIEIESSLNHRYRVVNNEQYEWKKVEDIVVGDKLAVSLGGHPTNLKYQEFTTHSTSTNNDYTTAPSVLNEKTASFVGWFYNQFYTRKERQHATISAYTHLHFSEHFDLDDERLIDWFVNNFEDDNFKTIRCSPKSVVIAFIKAISEKDGTISKEFPSELKQLIIILSRSVGIVNDSSVSWNNFQLDEIIEIEDSHCETYDISVDNVHHYKLNGVVSHNTLSLLGHVTSGVHPAYSQYYIRRIRISSENPLLKIAKKHGFKTEPVYKFDNTIDHTTSIIEFPYSFPEGTITADQLTAVDQLENVKRIQKDWSDNSVSVTVTYKLEELPAIKEWLSLNYNENIKSVSFLLYFNSGFKQCPLEPITKTEYLQLLKQTTPITDMSGICYTEESDELINQGECAGGVCPIR